MKQTIDSIVKENNHLYAELQEFITSDPVYDQVKLLETTNRHLQQELLQSNSQNAQLKKLINVDEIKHLKTLLAKTSDECEQLRLLNKKLVNEVDHRRGQTQTSSPKQVCTRRENLFATEFFHYYFQFWNTSYNKSI